MRAAVAAWGLPLCAKEPKWYSNTVSAIMVPQGIDGADVIDAAFRRYNLALGAGLSKVSGKLFRIGHLGDLNDLMVLGALAGGVLVQATGYSALKAAGAILEGSFGGSYPISQTLAAAIPLATIALGTAVAFRVQLWNIGGEGQFYMGAFGATGVELIGGPAGWPPLLHAPTRINRRSLDRMRVPTATPEPARSQSPRGVG